MWPPFRITHSEGVGPLRSSILSLIDLAGSENAKLTNATGGRQREGPWRGVEICLPCVVCGLGRPPHLRPPDGCCVVSWTGNYINKSLLALGHVIQKLSEASSRGSIRAGEGPTHVPFRYVVVCVCCALE